MTQGNVNPWRKSSYSFSNGNCVEAASFRKSSHSMNHGDCVEAMSFRKSSGSEASDCVEAGNGPGAVLVRDTKDRGTGPVLEFPAGAWAEFTAAVKRSQAAETRP